MKKLLIGLFALGAISAFANDTFTDRKVTGIIYDCQRKLIYADSGCCGGGMVPNIFLVEKKYYDDGFVSEKDIDRYGMLSRKKCERRAEYLTNAMAAQLVNP